MDSGPGSQGRHDRRPTARGSTASARTAEIQGSERSCPAPGARTAAFCAAFCPTIGTAKGTKAAEGSQLATTGAGATICPAQGRCSTVRTAEEPWMEEDPGLCFW